MTDTFSLSQRSMLMARIHSKWTSPEKLIHNRLKGLKVRHKMHPPLPGNPDVLMKDSRTVVFIHGCFWHKCPVCYSPPKSNVQYWSAKVERNVERDKAAKFHLRENGWRVVVLWEHDVNRKIKDCIDEITC